MAKRWLAIREKAVSVLRRSFIVSGYLATVVVVVGAVYLAKPLLWSGGLGIGKDQAVTTESVEKDAKGKVVKSIKTTKYDDGKTLWDWLSLLGVPLSLAILGFWLQQSQQKRAERVAKEQRERDEKLAKEQREIAAAETKEEILQVYFDRLAVLLVDKNLLAIAAKVYASETQKRGVLPKIEPTLEERELLDSAVDVIRARTLSILRRFENDPERKTSVIRFLIEADIISKLKLSLREANLYNADLHDANLHDADLRDADLRDADLRDANLIEADLSGANLERAKLTNAHLLNADLSEANLCSARIREAKLEGANLSKANLSGARLNDAKLVGTNLDNAVLTNTRFGNNLGLGDTTKADMIERGAIFEDSP